MVFDIFDDVADGLDVLDLLVGDLAVELLLEGHDQVDDVQRVGAQVALDVGLHCDDVFLDVQLVHEKLSDFFKYHDCFLL